MRTLCLLLHVLLTSCRSAPCPELWVEPASGIEFRRLPTGTHRIGSSDSEKDREAQEVLHSVRLDRCVGLATTEVTQAQWKAVLHEAPSQFSECGPACPVESVTLPDVERLLERLRALAPAQGMRLPTEAEWEIACRAGGAAAFSVGDELAAAAANFDRTAPTPVRTFPPNAWGFFDLHGNVWEWTADEHCPYPRELSNASNPLRCGAAFHVIRGGSWHFGPDSARCALRYTHRPADRGPSLGVRLASEPVRQVRRDPPGTVRRSSALAISEAGHHDQVVRGEALVEGHQAVIGSPQDHEQVPGS